MTDSLRSLVARSYKLRIVPGEILLAEVTIEVVAKDGTLNSLLTAIRECSVFIMHLPISNRRDLFSPACLTCIFGLLNFS